MLLCVVLNKKGAKKKKKKKKNQKILMIFYEGTTPITTKITLRVEYNPSVHCPIRSHTRDRGGGGTFARQR
jgi:hypothetical protein